MWPVLHCTDTAVAVFSSSFRSSRGQFNKWSHFPEEHQITFNSATAEMRERRRIKSTVVGQ